MHHRLTETELTDTHSRGGRPRSPEGHLDDRERRKRERWRAYSAARHEAQRPQREALARAKATEREAQRLQRSQERPARAKTVNRRKATERVREGIPAGDKRPW